MTLKQIGKCYNPIFFSLLQEQYMAISLTLNEEFKAGIEPQNVSNFADSVANLTEKIPVKQAFIQEQFEVKIKTIKSDVYICL